MLMSMFHANLIYYDIMQQYSINTVFSIHYTDNVYSILLVSTSPVY